MAIDRLGMDTGARILEERTAARKRSDIKKGEGVGKAEIGVNRERLEGPRGSEHDWRSG